MEKTSRRGRSCRRRGRLAFVAFLVGALVLFSSCAGRIDKTPEALAADQVRIFYGVSSWAMFGAPAAAVQTLTEMYNNLELQESEEQLDFATAFNISFSEGVQTVGGWSVDEQGVCQISGDAATYRIVSQSFDYQAIKDIYENSKDGEGYVDGFYQPDQPSESEPANQVMNAALLEDWPQGTIDLISHMSAEQKKALYAAVPNDGTVEEIAQQLISQQIAAYDGSPAYAEIEGSWSETKDTIAIVDAELTEVNLIASYEEASDEPLYLYEPVFRIRPADPSQVIPAGAVSVDEQGWIVDGNSARHRMLLTQNADGSYHYLGCPEFDLQLNYGIRLLVVDEPAAALDFTFISDFMFTLGRQFGYYPWADYEMDIPMPEQVINTDMAGMDFYRATFSPRATSGETMIAYYTIGETWRTYIYEMHTTDPYVSTGISIIAGGENEVRVGMSEADLLAAYSDSLSENKLMEYSADNFCPYDKVYEYAPATYQGQQIIRFYLKLGLISGIEMFYQLN